MDLDLYDEYEEDFYAAYADLYDDTLEDNGVDELFINRPEAKELLDKYFS